MKKDFLVILSVGLRGNVDASVTRYANFFFICCLVFQTEYGVSGESMATELFVPDYISQRIVTWFLFN